MYTARKEFVVVIATVVFSNCMSVQNFERYRPQTLTSGPVTRPQLQDVPAPVHGSDRVLLDAFNAVIVVDDVSQVDPQNANADAVGLVRRPYVTGAFRCLRKCRAAASEAAGFSAQPESALPRYHQLLSTQ